MPASGTVFELYRRASSRRFQPSEEADLIEALRTSDAATSCHPVESPRELQLDSDGKTIQGGYRFVVGSFAQVSRRLAQGLSRFMADISGVRRHREERFADGLWARRLWNDLVDMRFGLLARFRLVRNDVDRTIDGLLGMRQTYVENVDFYGNAVEVLRQAVPGLVFHAGSLLGRRMIVWLRDTTPLFRAEFGADSFPIYRGFYFGNGEVAGTAARVTNALFCRYGVCLLPYRRFGRKMRHTGKDVVPRFASHLLHSAQVILDAESLANHFRRAFGETLGYRADFTDRQKQKQARKLIHTLAVLGVPQGLAGETVADALEVGYDLPRGQLPAQRRLYHQRTAADLFASLLHLSRRLDPDRRELLEQAAFGVLTNSLQGDT